MPRGPAIFVLALALAGCGSAPEAREPDGTIELTLNDFRIAPQVVRAPGRTELTIIARNVGRLPHNLQIGGTRRTLVKFATMKPGESVARVVKLPRGDWRMVCSLANHEELGQYGTLILR